MKAQHRINVIADPRARYAEITKDYLADPEHTLVLTTDNRSRKELNETIHTALRENGHLTGEDRTIPTLITRQAVRESDKTWAGTYKTNDTIRFTTGSKKYGIAPREYVTVTAVNAQDNTLTIRKDDGTFITYDPSRNHGVTVFEHGKVQFASGETIQFTQPLKDHKIANPRSRPSSHPLERTRTHRSP